MTVSVKKIMIYINESVKLTFKLFRPIYVYTVIFTLRPRLHKLHLTVHYCSPRVTILQCNKRHK